MMSQTVSGTIRIRAMVIRLGRLTGTGMRAPSYDTGGFYHENRRCKAFSSARPPFQ